MEGPGRHVAVVEDAADEREGGIAGGEDDLVGELKAEVVRDENEEVGEVAERGGDLCVVMAWVTRVSIVESHVVLQAYYNYHSDLGESWVWLRHRSCVLSSRFSSVSVEARRAWRLLDRESLVLQRCGCRALSTSDSIS